VAIVVFTHPTSFPIAPMREMLSRALKDYRWVIGEEDDGGPETMAQWKDHQLISGRSSSAPVFCEVMTKSGQFPDAAPLHTWHLETKRPTTDDDGLANRITVLVCAVSMMPDEQSMCQLVPGGPWLNHDAMGEASKAVLAGESFESVAQLGCSADDANMPARGDGRYADLPPDRAASLASMDEVMARQLHEMGWGDIADGMGLTVPPGFAHEMPRDNALPTLVMLSTEPLFLDWLRISEMLKGLDPRGDWKIEPSGPNTGSFSGRGATVTITCDNQPLPGYLTAQGLSREHYLTAEHRAQITSHCCQHIISVDLDTRAADFMDVRQTAKVVAMFMALPSTSTDFVGLFNAGTGVAKPAERVRDSIAALHDDEVPLQIWTWVAPDSIVADAIALSSAGMLPFTGYEVECWNAPGSLAEVGDRINGVMRYLVINGPVIKHGDTIGDSAGDKSTRCFFAPSKAQRGEEAVPAMHLEFDGRSGSAPKPDVPMGAEGQGPHDLMKLIQSEQGPEMTDLGYGLYDLMSLVALTKETVFPSNIIQEMLGTNFPDFRWTVNIGRGSGPDAHEIFGEHKLQRVTVRVDARGLSLPADLMPPPHKLHLRVVVDALEDMALARRVSLVVCCCLIISLDDKAHFQLAADGNWLTHDDALTGVMMPRHVRDIGDFDRVFGIDPQKFARVDPYLDGAYEQCPTGFTDLYRAVRTATEQEIGTELKQAFAVPKPPAAAAPPVAQSGFGRRVGGFGRKGL
jgi:Domain of unknown function (DUF4261)